MVLRPAPGNIALAVVEFGLSFCSSGNGCGAHTGPSTMLAMPSSVSTMKRSKCERSVATT
eukprot:5379460-Amphidinium_carterae.1